MDRRSEPRLERPLIPSGVLGMLLFVFTEAMLFAGLISAHAIVRAGQTEWPPPGQPRLPVEATMVNTVALLASGVLMVFAHFSFRRRPALAKTPLLLALLLGLFFVVAQGREWAALLAQGVTVSSNTFASFFYVIIGTHALHAIGAIGGVAWAWWRLRRGALLPSQLWTVETFWYFVVLIWPILYLRVYL